MLDDGPEERPDHGPLLPPEDRLWRHPSEVGSTAPPAGGGPDATSATPGPGGSRFPWALSLVSAVAGATAAIGVILIAGGLSGSQLQRPVARPLGEQAAVTIPTSARPGGIAEIVSSFGPALVRLELPDDDTASGVLYEGGLVITTAHGLDEADAVPVVLADGRQLDGDVVGVDRWTDLAVLRLAHDGEAAALGSSAQVAVGDAALLVAAPLGEGTSPTVTVGVVSAVEQAMTAEERTLRGLIRADAGVAPSTTGGALLDDTGALVGIVTVPTSDEHAGVGYAVPADLVRTVVADLLEHGRARHAWLGIEGLDTAEGGTVEGGTGTGVLVDEVVPEGPAAAAGMEAGDVVVAVDGEAVATMADLVRLLRAHEPGAQVEVGLLRGGTSTAVEVTLGERG